MNKSFSYNYLIVNYILVLYLIIYTGVNALIDPFKVTTRRDFIVTNIINFISLFFVLFNELSLYVNNDYIYGLWIVKTIIISILLFFIVMISIRNYCIEKKHRDNNKKVEMIEISLPTSQDIDV